MAKAAKDQDKPAKTSLSIRPSKMKKLRILAVYDNKSVTDLVDEGIDDIIKRLEKKYGEVK